MLVKWILSPQAMLNLPISWQALNGYWDNKQHMFLLVEHAKCRYGIDFLKFEEEHCIIKMGKHSIYQVKKPIANAIDKECSLTWQELSDKHKQEGKSWSLKRKPGVCKDDFITFRHRNTSKHKFNQCCDKYGLENHKVEIDEIDISYEKEPSKDILQVLMLITLSHGVIT